MRWWFAIKNAIKYRSKLKRFLVDPKSQIQHLKEITLERLDAADIAILVLDFDGVLAGHDANVLPPETEQWLRKLSLSVGEQRIAILTNKPKATRLRYLATIFPSIFVVTGVRKKPYPDGLLEIAQFKGVPPHRLVLVDDRLLTGMLATCLSYTQGWYFSHPYCNFRQHFFKECFFKFLRTFEKWWLR